MLSRMSPNTRTNDSGSTTSPIPYGMDAVLRGAMALSLIESIRAVVAVKVFVYESILWAISKGSTVAVDGARRLVRTVDEEDCCQ